MLKVFTLFALPVFCVAGPVSLPASGGYYNQAAFAAAIQEFAPGSTVYVDSFANGQIHEAGVSVSSDIDYNGYAVGAGNGQLIAGSYQETTGKYSTTVWTFSQPIYAFGGNWTMQSINAGLEVDSGNAVYFMPDGVVKPLSSYGFNSPPQWPAQGWSGFWGFVSETPINEVSISFGDEGFGGSYGQTYSFTNMETASVMAAAPEPSGIMLTAAGTLIALGLVRRRKGRP